MVRKRTRTTKTRRNSKKTYESDENDSDIELQLDSPPSSPAPKRYGLRQRKQPVFFEDFDYEDDDDISTQRRGSDDEEYSVEVDLHTELNNQYKRSSRNQVQYNNSLESSSYYNEPENEDISMENGLIDFEDVIRADVVVNKQRVDYDNMITKTEIQVEALNKTTVPVREKGRRGRKPKPRPELEITRISVLPNTEEINTTKNIQDDETNLEVQIDPSTLVQSDSDENDVTNKSNGVTLENTVNNCHTGPPKESISEKSAKSGSWVDKIEKYVPPELDEKEKEVMLSNEYLLANTFDVTADEFLQKREEKKNEVQEEVVEDNLPLLNFDEEEEDDDEDDDDDSSNDVVIIEKKPEIIVLDDD